MAKLFPSGYQFLDDNGDPVNSGTVNFYVNTTTTDKKVYTNSDLSTEATNPQPLDSAGRFNQGDLYGSGIYTVVLKDSAGTQIWSRDDHLSETEDINLMADLVAIDNPANNDRQTLTGFLSVGDGGGGDFYYDSSQSQSNHNGVTIIDPNHSVTPGSAGWWTNENAGSGCWMRVNSKYVSVLAGGAVDDDSTDAQASIQGVLDCGAEVVVVDEATTFRCDGALTVNANQTLRLDGTLKLYGTYGAETNFIAMSSGSRLKGHGFLEAGTRDTATGITDTKYGGDTSYNYLANTTAIGAISGSDVSDVEVHNVTIKYFQRGYNFSSFSSTIVSEKFKFINVNVIQCGQYLGTLFKLKDFEIRGGRYWHGGGNGITLPSTQNGLITGIRMWNPSGTGINPGGSTTSGLEVKHLTITGNHVFARDPFTCENGGQHLHISSNHFYPWSIDGTNGTGINVAAVSNGNGQDSYDIHIAGNHIYGGISADDHSGALASQGIVCKVTDTGNPAMRDITIVGNHLSSIDDDGIVVAGTATTNAEDVRIHGNSGRNVNRRGVQLTEVDNFSVHDNDFNRAASGVATATHQCYYFSNISDGTIYGNRSKHFYDHLYFTGTCSEVQAILRLSSDSSADGGEMILYSGQTGHSPLNVADITGGTGPLVEYHGHLAGGVDITSSTNLATGSKMIYRDSAYANNGPIGDVHLGSGTWIAYGYAYPEVTTANLTDISHSINTGAAKVEGYKVRNITTGLFVVAAGNADGSVWVYEGTGSTAHTPS